MKRIVILVLLLVIGFSVLQMYSYAMNIEEDQPHYGLTREFASFSDLKDHLKEMHTEEYPKGIRFEGLPDYWEDKNELGKLSLLQCGGDCIWTTYNYTTESNKVIKFNLVARETIHPELTYTEYIYEHYEVSQHIKKPDAYVDDIFILESNKKKTARIYVNENYFKEFENGDLTLKNGFDLSKYVDSIESISRSELHFRNENGAFDYWYQFRSADSGKHIYRAYPVYVDTQNEYTVQLSVEDTWDYPGNWYSDHLAECDELVQKLFHIDTYEEAWIDLLNIPEDQLGGDTTAPGGDTAAPGGDTTVPGSDKTDTDENAIGSDENEENKDSKTESVLPWVFLGAAGVLVLATALGILLHSRKKH